MASQQQQQQQQQHGWQQQGHGMASGELESVLVVCVASGKQGEHGVEAGDERRGAEWQEHAQRDA